MNFVLKKSVLALVLLLATQSHLHAMEVNINSMNRDQLNDFVNNAGGTHMLSPELRKAYEFREMAIEINAMSRNQLNDFIGNMGGAHKLAPEVNDLCVKRLLQFDYARPHPFAPESGIKKINKRRSRTQ